MLEASILAVVLAAPYFLVDYGWAAKFGYAIVPGYVLWTLARLYRYPSYPMRLTLLQVGIGAAVPFMAAGLFMAAAAGWLSWAYRADAAPGRQLDKMWLVSALIILVPALYLVLVRTLFPALARLGREGGAAPNSLPP